MRSYTTISIINTICANTITTITNPLPFPSHHSVQHRYPLSTDIHIPVCTNTIHPTYSLPLSAPTLSQAHPHPIIMSINTIPSLSPFPSLCTNTIPSSSTFHHYEPQHHPQPIYIPSLCTKCYLEPIYISYLCTQHDAEHNPKTTPSALTPSLPIPVCLKGPTLS